MSSTLASADASSWSDTRFWTAQRDAFRAVRDALQTHDWGARGTLPAEAGLHRRLLDAAAGVEHGESGPADIAALVGAILRREMARPQRLEVPSLQLPQGNGWPTPEQLRRASVHGARVGRTVRVEAVSWLPGWLNSKGEGPLAGIDAMRLRRRRWRVDADLFFSSATGLTTYSSSGQRDAARAVSATEPGGAVIVSLPTGTGKTIVGLFRALDPAARGTTVVFVPTVSLARDQEAELRNAIEAGRLGRSLQHRNFAYVGATPESDRLSIRERVRDGSQAVVFTAPESMASLRPAIESAARDGLISAFVIDEAHAVADWGSDFRPAFQMLSGLRRGLLNVSPREARFPTILLTGTLTADALATTCTFLGASLAEPPDAPVRVVVEEGLRPEPAYWLGECHDEDERASRVVELAYHVPRPAIVYTNRPLQARQLVEALRHAGFWRVAEYTGETPDNERRNVEQTWRDAGGAVTSYDVVVATSAFGLGINQTDVRAVIHARVPESLNRYYQEVGRGGRDGRASLAVLLNDPGGDFRDAERIAGQQLLRDRLEPRWQTMFAEKRSADAEGSVYWFNVAAIPFDHRGRRNRAVKKDRLWNMNALTLLQRAGLVRLHEPLDADRPEDGEWVGVEILDPRVLTEGWRRAWEQVRVDARSSRGSELTFLREIVASARPTEHILRDALTIDVFGNLMRLNDTCGGCPVCRRDGFGARCEYASSRLAESGIVETRFARELRERFGTRLLLVHYQGGEFADATAFVRRTVELGLRRLAVVGRETSEFDARLLAEHFVFIEREIPDNPWLSWSGSVESIFVSSSDTALQSWCVEAPFAAVRIVLFPKDMSDPDRPDRALAEMRDVWTLGSVSSLMRTWLF